MLEHDRIIALLEQVVQNQIGSMKTQEEHLGLAREQIARTEKRVEESIALQRVSVSRQAKALAVVLPLIAVLGALALYLVFSRLSG